MSQLETNTDLFSEFSETKFCYLSRGDTVKKYF